MTLCGANYHEWVRDVKGVAALGELYSRDRIWCTHVPILNHTWGIEYLSLKQGCRTRITLIVLSCSKNATLGRFEPFDDLDRRIVLSNLLRLSSLNVEKTRDILTTTRNDLVPFL